MLKDAGLQAILAFLNGIDLKQLEALSVWPDILSVNPVITFRLHGDVELVCQPRSFDDYDVAVGKANLPLGVTLL